MLYRWRVAFCSSLASFRQNQSTAEEMKQSGKEVVERDTASKREAEGKEISEGEK